MISIVDDDESVRESTKALLRSLGYSARTFASAEEFLDSDLDETNCLILDVQMTGLSGVELLERLTAEGRQTPVIFVTAFPDERIRNHVLDAGAVGFLSQAGQRREAHLLPRHGSPFLSFYCPFIDGLLHVLRALGVSQMTALFSNTLGSMSPLAVGELDGCTRFRHLADRLAWLAKS